jgi:hypothetical protein
MGLFGPTKKEISWRRFASEVGGTFHYSARFYLWDDYHILVRKAPWTITLDTCGTGGENSLYYTNMSAPYISDDGLEFEMLFSSRVERLLNKLGRKKYIEIGYPEFDSEYDIHACNESKAQELFRNAKIRQLIHSVMSKSKKGDPIPGNGSGVLRAGNEREWSTYWTALSYCESGHPITDIARLKSILELITEVLNQMREIGSASPIAPSE